MGTSRFFLLIAATMAGLWGQLPDDRALTNANIEAMLTGGLPKSTIVMTIQKAAYFGLVDLDTSTGALIRLKDKGADEEILNTVIWAEPYGDQLKEERAAAQRAALQREAEERAVPGLPDSAGVYFKGPSGWVKLSSFLFWAPLYSGDAWFHKRHEYAVPIGEGHWDAQVTGAMPAFYVREPSPGETWHLIQVTSGRASTHKDERQIHLTSDLKFDHDETLAGSQVHEVQMTPVAGSIFSLHPAPQPGAGEYILCTTVQGGPGLEHCYGFGIRP